MVVGEIIESAAMAAPDALAVTMDEDCISYRELHDRGCQYANVLQELDLRVGDRCLVWSENSLLYTQLFAGLSIRGVVFVPVVSNLNVQEVIPTAEYIRPTALISDGAHLAQAREVAIAANIPLYMFDAGNEGLAAGFQTTDLDALAVEAPTSYSGAGPGEDDLHAIFLTSGSTGRQKGVMLTHRTNWLRVFSGVGPHMPAGGAGMVNMFPLSHFAGWHFITLMWPRRRASHLVKRADPDLLLSAVDRWDASELYAIPAVWHRIFECDRTRYDLSSLEYANTGTSRTSPEFLSEIKLCFPRTKTTVSYGATEVPTIATLSDSDVSGPHAHSVGLPAPGCVVSLAKDGEIRVRSELMMKGYFERPEETAKAIRDGWYHTGDVGELRDGYLTIVGRNREIIRTGGKTVVPAEVEAAVIAYPGVKDVGIVGISDAVWGEIIAACLVMDGKTEAPNESALRDFLRNKLAAFKQPRMVRVISEIPRTNATGQVKRKLLQQLLLNDVPDGC